MKLKTSDDVALTPWLVSALTEICFLIYSLRHEADYWIVFGAVFELVLAVATAITLLIFRRKRKPV